MAAYDEENERIKVKVSDTGTSMNELEMGQLLQMFGKGNGQTDEVNAEGIGLGLIICKQIIEISGG